MEPAESSIAKKTAVQDLPLCAPEPLDLAAFDLPAEDVAPKRCLNCETELTGPFCSNCGQEDQPVRVPIQHLLRDVFEEFFKLDGKLPATLRLLLLRPGELTNEYVAGRRAGYLPPFKLLFSLAALFLLLFTLSGRDKQQIREMVHSAPPPAASTSSPSSSSTQPEVRPEDQVVDRSAEWLVNNLNLLTFALTPFLALMLHGIYRRSGRYYIEHLVFAVHVQAALFLVDLFLLPLPSRWVDVLELPIGGVYFLLALRSVYRQTWPRTLLIGTVVATGYALMAILMIFGVWIVMALHHAITS